MFLSGLIIGFLGSLHCIGMCGPIALALPVKNDSKSIVLIKRYFYNFGRIFTYSFLGLIFGLLGEGLNLIGLQRIVSISFGIIIVLYVLIFRKTNLSLLQIPFVSKIFLILKNSLTYFLNKNTILSQFIIGILNGFLPCGLVYVAIAGAIALGNIEQSILFMFFFGVGTFPAMLLASIIPSFISLKSRIKIRKLIPVLSLLLAVIFILRGMNLGIPYLSPRIEASQIQNQNLEHHCQ
ncbi:MAG: sulfite exporter TauE/SafE family protein [Ignavibacterium sp.]